MPARVMLMLVVCAAIGCTGSRWARNDPDYAAKYPHHTDNVLKMAKQAVDARHVEGKGGWYGGFAGRNDPNAFGAEVGLFQYRQPWLETRAALEALLRDGDAPLTGGVTAGVRVQSPSRVAPFVGLGGYAGWMPSIETDDSDWDWSDLDGDGRPDDADKDNNDVLLAVFPEVGCHVWLSARWRLTASASYQFTTDGRNSDFLLYGVSLARLLGVHRAARFDDPLSVMTQPDAPTADPAVCETLDRCLAPPDCGSPADATAVAPTQPAPPGPYRLPPPDDSATVP